MNRTLPRLVAVVGVTLLLAGCSPSAPDSTEPSVAESSIPSPRVSQSVTDALGGCPPELLTSISAEVSPTVVDEIAPSADVTPEGVTFSSRPTCVIEYQVPTGEGRQLFYAGASATVWQEFVDAMSGADFVLAGDGVILGTVDEGLIGGAWYRGDGPETTADTTIVNAGWVAGPDIEGAPADAAIFGEPYMVLTVEECPCE